MIVEFFTLLESPVSEVVETEIPEEKPEEIEERSAFEKVTIQTSMEPSECSGTEVSQTGIAIETPKKGRLKKEQLKKYQRREDLFFQIFR